MQVTCAPLNQLPAPGESGLQAVLYGHADRDDRASAGAGILDLVQRSKLQPSSRAWDLLSIALSVNAADLAVLRSTSPDGWTREFELLIAVGDPDFWNAQRGIVEQCLRFLTTDIWQIQFTGDGLLPAPPKQPVPGTEDSVALLSGGLDSLIGALDLTGRDGLKPCLVSQVAWGDKEKQTYFAQNIAGGLRHLQLNHNITTPGQNERSQRARSTIFLAYGVLAATALERYQNGDTVTLYIPENGFISINPPLTSGRIGSLSTRTTHPVFIGLLQRLLDAAGLRVRLQNPHQFATKGEMLAGCANQPFLLKHAHGTTSCSRYGYYNYTHCGRCVPCLVRRAAFHRWGQKDATGYKFTDLAQDDDNHARFDDVRSVAMAIAAYRADGLDTWLGAAMSSTLMGDLTRYRDTVERGLLELAAYLDSCGVT